MAYFGDPILADDLLFRPEHSIIDQSLHARLGGVTTNGDGFGIGWYPDGGVTPPAVFKGTHPAWNDRNLREVATQIHTPLLFAHVRASSGTPVQRSNCHRSDMAGGCGCTTDRSPGSTRSNAIF
jgi:glutamine amidotransferase